jgi:hypothetical protein
MVFPYLKEDAVLVFHDVNLQTNLTFDCQLAHTNNLLISAIFGTKLLQGNFASADTAGNGTTTLLPNIAGIKLNGDTKRHLFEVFNILATVWTYVPVPQEQDAILRHFSRFYDPRFIATLQDLFAFRTEWLERQEEELESGRGVVL